MVKDLEKRSGKPVNSDVLKNYLASSKYNRLRRLKRVADSYRKIQKKLDQAKAMVEARNYLSKRLRDFYP